MGMDRGMSAINKFKDIFQADLLLTHFNLQLPITVAVDASQTDISSCIFTNLKMYLQNSFCVVGASSKWKPSEKVCEIIYCRDHANNTFKKTPGKYIVTIFDTTDTIHYSDRWKINQRLVKKSRLTKRITMRCWETVF